MRPMWAVLALVAIDATAAPVRVTLGGKAVDGAEVCWFKTLDAVTCRAATEGVPAGDWKIFARRGDQLVSDRVATSGDLAVVTAAKLRDAAYVYVPRTRSILPVHNGLVPADTDLVPLAIAGGKVTGFGPILNVRAGASAKAEFVDARDGRTNVIAVVAARDKSDTRVAAPEVVVQSGEKREKALDPLRSTDTTPAMLFFRDVPQTGAKLVLSGNRWKTVEVPFGGKEKILQLDPITAAQTSKLEVRWWAPVDPAKLASKQTDCKITKSALPFFEKRSTEPKFVAILQSCPKPRTPCTETARRALPIGAMKGALSIEDVSAGTYGLEFDYPGLPPIYKGVEVTSSETTTVDVPLHYIAFFGKVTRGAKPVHAMVYGAVTDPDTGEYNAVVTRLPGAGTTEVLPCDGGAPYRFVPDEAPKENAAFDIDIPDNRLAVEVYDKDSGAPVAEANVSFGAEEPGQSKSMHFMGSAGQTDRDGKITIAPVLQNRMVKLCADREDYEHECVPDFKMDAPEKTVRLDLKKVHVHQGRVEGGAGTFARLVWFSPQTGAMTELLPSSSFKDDGSFTYKKDHAPGEVVVLIASDRPLYAFLQPLLDPDAVFDIARPAVPVRTFTVAQAPTAREAAWPALIIGNVIVPVNALMWHLGPRLHGFGALQPGSSVVVSDVLETGPIKVLLVTQSVGGHYPAQVNLPLVPEFAAFPQQDLGNADSVTFP